ncbi:hypothetical protein Q4Q80_03575, partial [Morganella morganii]
RGCNPTSSKFIHTWLRFGEIMRGSLRAQLDKDSAIVPVYYYVSTRLVKPYVGGYTGKDPLDHFHTKNLYMIKK